MDDWEKLFYDNLTVYAFSEVQTQLKLSRDMKPVCIKVVEHHLIIVGKKSYDSNGLVQMLLKKEMGLPCNH